MTEKKRNNLTLLQLGWRPFFQQQLGLEEWEYPAFRVIAQYRDRLELLGEQSELGLTCIRTCLQLQWVTGCC